MERIGWTGDIEGAPGNPPELEPMALGRLGLRSAVLATLLSDAICTEDEAVVYPTTDRRGWWPEAVTGISYGSKLWLLDREPLTGAVVGRAVDYATEALAWLVDEGVATGVEVTGEIATINGVRTPLLTIEITRGEVDDAVTFRFANLWGEMWL